MRIISKFKDYYDYVEYLHSGKGGDPKITYNRNRMSKLYVDEFKLPNQFNYFISYAERIDLNGMKFKFLVMCGKYYTLCSYKNSGYFPFVEYHKAFNVVKKYFSKIHYTKINLESKNLIGISDSKLDIVSHKIRQPIFLLGRQINYLTWNIDEVIPILKNYGIPSLFQPEDLYQKIAAYMSEVVIDQPEMAVITDMDRYVGHGFDKKSSFRHPIK